MPNHALDTTVPPVRLALDLAAVGWHVFPLNPRDKRPLANCLDCRDNPTCARDDYTGCRCLPDGQWCHGVRAATTDPDRITTWWRRQSDAVPAAAAGPSGLILLDLDHHTTHPPNDPATELLPGTDLTTAHLPANAAARLAEIRDGAEVLQLLAHLRGGARPWPTGPAHRPVCVTTPSGGRHLWYCAPATGGRLRQALGELGWQIDIKAGWSYGIVPGAATRAGTYTLQAGDPAAPGRMPTWLTLEVLRVTTPRPKAPAPALARQDTSGRERVAAYLTAVIERGAADLAPLTDGRKTALSALAYKTGGLLAASGLNHTTVQERLTAAGRATGLDHRTAHRIVHRALTNGLARPLPAPPDRTNR